MLGPPEAVCFSPSGSIVHLHSLASCSGNSSALSHIVVCRDLDHLDLPHNITLAHYTDDVMQFESDEQEVVNTTNVLVKLYEPEVER